MLVLLVGSAAAFLGLYAAEAALPRIRRSQVRDALPERGVREAAVRKLRSDRSAYQEVARLLSLFFVVAATALALGLMVRAFDWPWPAMGAGLVALCAAVFLPMIVIRALVARASTVMLMYMAVAILLTLWPLLPLRQLAGAVRTSLPQEQPPAPTLPTGAAERQEEEPVEEQIAEEQLDPRERSMISAILRLEETTVREIMVPRVDVYALEVSAPLEEASRKLLDSGHSRLPVFEETLDNVVGVLYIRDLLAAFRENGETPPILRDLVRPAFFVPESKRADEMLTEFQERRVQTAVVVDEYGGVAGLVTTEDLLEEIVGEIEDEFDVTEPNIEQGEDGLSAVVDARMPIDVFNDAFQADLNAEGFDTLGGFLYSRLGKIPTAGDTVEASGLEIGVVTTLGRRIKKVRVHRASQPPADPSASNGAP